MQVFEVGGAVRDRLLGLPVRDRDWVVVGSTPDAMEALGYKPVGRDFPVFLHPDTHEEYALARTERKVAPGYHGFQFHADAAVTLEQDLLRRDLTINAMAADATGRVIDPYGGQADLQARLLRHVSPAFAEDPVRILRIARFAARFDFAVAPETLALMRQMVTAGEVDALVAERVWQELAKGLMEPHPLRFFQVLADCGALEICLPGCGGLARIEPVPADDQSGEGARVAPPAPGEAAQGLLRAASLELALAPRIAILALCTRDVLLLAERLRWPAALQDLARLCVQQAAVLRGGLWQPGDEHALLLLLEKSDALRRPQRLEEALTGVACLLPPKSGRRAMATVLAALNAARSIDAGALAAGAASPAEIPQRVRAARLAAVTDVLQARAAAG